MKNKLQISFLKTDRLLFHLGAKLPDSRKWLTLLILFVYLFNKNGQNYLIIANKVLNLIICNRTKLTATNYYTYLKKINK